MMRILRRFGGTIFLALAVLAGCTTTRNEAFLEADRAAAQGRFADAAALISGSNRDQLYSPRDRVVHYLDLGALQHYAGDYQAGIQSFHEAERLIEEYFSRSISQAAASLLLNDTAMDYPGEDYEDIYLNVFNAISYLKQRDFEGAFVEVRRINLKLTLLRDKYQQLGQEYGRADDAALEIKPGESQFYNSALARYLSMVMYRADGDPDGARIDFQSIQEAFARQTNIYGFANPLTPAVLDRPTGAWLSVLAFTGRAPIKRADTLYIVTGQDSLTILILTETDGRMREQAYGRFPWPGIKSGYRFKFQMPRMELQNSAVASIRVVLNGQPLGDLQLFEDMQKIASDTFEIKLPMIYLKTITRTVVKGVVAQQAKEQMQAAGQRSGSTLGLVAGILGSIAADIAVDVSEEADLRSSRYFPAFAHVGEWDVPPGVHRVRIEYYSNRGLLHVEDLGEVTVTDRGLNLLTSYLLQ